MPKIETTEMQHKGVGHYLKSSESTFALIAIDAPAGTKAGTFVDYPLRGKKLLALANEENGKVLVQTHNCLIDLSDVSADVLTDAELDTITLFREGDAYGIVYSNAPEVGAPPFDEL